MDGNPCSREGKRCIKAVLSISIGTVSDHENERTKENIRDGHVQRIHLKKDADLYDTFDVLEHFAAVI